MPGTYFSLQQAKAEGANARVVYSTMEMPEKFVR